MKKRTLVLGVCLFALLLSSCDSFAGTGDSEKNKAKTQVKMEDFEVLEVGSYDDLDGGKHTSEYPLWSSEKLNYYQDATALQTVSVTFNGVEYSGVYKRTGMWIPNTYAVHKYRAEHKGESVYFDINATTGQLTGISFLNDYSQYDAFLCEKHKCDVNHKLLK